MLARWSRRLGPDAGTELQLYYDRTRRSNSTLTEVRDTCDLDFKHQLNAFDRHMLVWGAGYRLTQDDITRTTGSVFTFEPIQRDAATFSAFVQDDMHFSTTICT